MKKRARNYLIVDEFLSKYGTCTPLLECISQQQGVALLNEIHIGICGIHVGVRSLVSKAFRQGFYWPTALRDAKNNVKTCDACQKFGNKISNPSQLTHRKLQRWRIDLVGPLPTANGNYTHAVVALDYFTK